MPEQMHDQYSNAYWLATDWCEDGTPGAFLCRLCQSRGTEAKFSHYANMIKHAHQHAAEERARLQPEEVEAISRRKAGRADGAKLLHLLADEVESGRRDGFVVMVLDDRGGGFDAYGYYGDSLRWSYEMFKNLALDIALNVREKERGRPGSNPLPWETQH